MTEDRPFSIGLGYDIHRLVPGRKLVLGGVTLDHDTGLDGHSDADVVLHAVMDALLGAAGLGDIGRHFPNAEERWRGASSLDLLSEVQRLLETSGWRVGNVDIMIVAEGPRLSDNVDEMRTGIASRLNIQPGDVNVKATTAEGLGPEGRLEAISAQAVALLVRRT